MSHGLFDDFFHFGGRLECGGGGGCGDGAHRRAQRALPPHALCHTGGALHHAGRAVPGRGADHHLCRRHRDLDPLCDHAHRFAGTGDTRRVPHLGALCRAGARPGAAGQHDLRHHADADYAGGEPRQRGRRTHRAGHVPLYTEHPAGGVGVGAAAGGAAGRAAAGAEAERSVNC